MLKIFLQHGSRPLLRTPWREKVLSVYTTVLNNEISKAKYSCLWCLWHFVSWKNLPASRFEPLTFRPSHVCIPLLSAVEIGSELVAHTLVVAFLLMSSRTESAHPAMCLSNCLTSKSAFWGAAQHRGSICESHPAVMGSNFGVPNFLTNEILSATSRKR